MRVDQKELESREIEDMREQERLCGTDLERTHFSPALNTEELALIERIRNIPLNRINPSIEVMRLFNKLRIPYTSGSIRKEYV